MDNVAARQQMVDQQIRTWEVLDPRVSTCCPRCRAKRSCPPRIVNSLSPTRRFPSDSVSTCWLRCCRGGSCKRSHQQLRQRAGSGHRHRLLERVHELARASTHSIDIQAEFTAAAAANLRAVPQARVSLERRDAFSSAAFSEYDAIAVTGSLPVYDARFQKHCASAAVCSPWSASRR